MEVVMDIEIVKFVQRASGDFLDRVFSLVTTLGETTIFFMVFVALYLCYRKEFAIKYLFVFMLTGIVNGGLKSIFARPRPYTQSGVLDIKHTSGYSFPSGHSNSIATQSTMIAVEYFKKNKGDKGRIILLSGLALLCVVVAFSRIYLGQHYLTDVLAGLVLGLGITLGVEYLLSLFARKSKKNISARKFMMIMIAPILVAIAIIEGAGLGSDSMLNTFYTYFAMYMGVLVGHNIDKSLVGYVEKNVWYIQIVKFAIACLGVFGLSYAFSWIAIDRVRNFTFYFASAIYVTAILPVLFKLVFSPKRSDKVDNLEVSK